MTITAQRVTVPKLGIHGWLIAVQPSETPGGVTRYRVAWLEPALGYARREANFWLEDMQFVDVAEVEAA